MKKAKVFMVLLPLVLISTILLGQMVLAANNPTISRVVIGGGGGMITDGNLYKINTVIGEPIVSNSTVGGTYRIGSGYLTDSITGTITINNNNIYLPMVIKQ